MAPPPKKKLKRLVDLEREKETGGWDSDEEEEEELAIGIGDAGDDAEERAVVVPDTPPVRTTRRSAAAHLASSTSTTEVIGKSSIERATVVGSSNRRGAKGSETGGEAWDTERRISLKDSTQIRAKIITRHLRSSAPSAAFVAANPQPPPPRGRLTRSKVSATSQYQTAAASESDLDTIAHEIPDEEIITDSDEEFQASPKRRTGLGSARNGILASSSSAFGRKKSRISTPVSSQFNSGVATVAASNVPSFMSSRATSLPPSSIPPNNHRPISLFLGHNSNQNSAITPSSQPQQKPVALNSESVARGGRIGAGSELGGSQSVASLLGIENIEDILDDFSDIDEFSDDEPVLKKVSGGNHKGTNTTSTSTSIRANLVVPNHGQLTRLRRPSLGLASLGSQGNKILPSGLKRATPPVVLPPPPPSPGTTVPLDLTLPWPMKHAPSSVSGLAVHSKKVAEVEDWLGRVYGGYSRKRVLLLKGPTGCGKTITLQVLASRGQWDVVEWVNPSSSGSGGFSENSGWSSENGWNGGRGSGGGVGFANAFEDWLFRSGKWGCLELSSSAAPDLLTPAPNFSSSEDPSKRKLLLLEDLPNLSHPGTLLSFRSSIRSYLALPSSSPGDPPIPPLIIIISECSEGAGSSTAMSMSAHRILGTPILSHPLTSSIGFRKVAKTLLVKCMDEVLKREGFQGVLSKEVLERLAEAGDLRGALSGLEILLLGKTGEKKVDMFGNTTKSGRRKNVKGAKSTAKNGGKANQAILDLISPRHSTLGIFHTIGKVVYNKRYGDDPSDPYFPPPPEPPSLLKNYHRYHNRAMKIDPNTILDESGVDANMFIYGVQENYLASCTTLGGKPGGAGASGSGTLEDLLEDVNFCVDGLSDGDLLMGVMLGRGGGGGGGGGTGSGDLAGGVTRAGDGSGWGVDYGGGGSGGHGGEGIIRQEEIAAQVVVRSLALGLPSPVKRDNAIASGYNRNAALDRTTNQHKNSGEKTSGWGSGGSKMYYPMGLRLWRTKEEIEGIVEICEERIRGGRIGTGDSGGGGLMMMGGLTRAELVLERLPYMSQIGRGRLAAAAGSAASTAVSTKSTLMTQPRPQWQPHSGVRITTATILNKYGIGTMKTPLPLTAFSNKSTTTSTTTPKTPSPMTIPPTILHTLEKITVFKGISLKPTEDAEEDEIDLDFDLEACKDEEGTDTHFTRATRGREPGRPKPGLGGKSRSNDGSGLPPHENRALTLPEDDIEDDDEDW